MLRLLFPEHRLHPIKPSQVLSPETCLHKFFTECLSRQGDNCVVQKVQTAIFQQREDEFSISELDPKCAASGVWDTKFSLLGMNKNTFMIVDRTILIEYWLPLRQIQWLMQFLFGIDHRQPDNMIPDTTANLLVTGFPHWFPRVIFNIANFTRWNDRHALRRNRKMVFTLGRYTLYNLCYS